MAALGVGTEFVAGWIVEQILGEGAFGEVKLLINQNTGEAVALKIVDLERHPDASEAVKKEVCLHRKLKHTNIIKFFGHRTEEKMQYMFLEYAVGGELFDRIEPDVGMPSSQAQKYFKDLINGVEYLHSQGVAHRDIKPENLLLDDNDVLKITDFGMATVFKHNEKERDLDRICGTKPYMPPEMIQLQRPYKAEPADIWSCGVVLVALLAGELPWDEPTHKCPEYQAWHERENSLMGRSPWRKIDNFALSLLRRILNTTPRYRITIAAIKSNSWMNRDFTRPVLNVSGLDSSLNTTMERRIASVFETSHLNLHDLSTRLACSQPDPRVAVPMDSDNSILEAVPYCMSISQPANAEDLFISQLTSQDSGSQNPLQKLGRRMTRIMVKTSLQDTKKKLERVFAKLSYSSKIQPLNVLTVATKDRRNVDLIFKVNILDMGHHLLLDFRLSKGCGIDFKRIFIKVKNKLKDIEMKGPLTWSMALANNKLPAGV